MRWRPVRSLRTIVGSMVVLLVLLVLLTAGAATVARSRASEANNTLLTTLIPAREAAVRLTKAYVDQETGQRGYLLAADPRTLEPYNSGRADAVRLTDQLQRTLTGYPDGRKLLNLVEQSGLAWQRQAAEPEIAANSQAPLGPDQVGATTLRDKALFDALRARLADLEQWTSDQTITQLATIQGDRAVFITVAIATVAAAVLAGLAFLPVTHRLFIGPLDSLVSQVGLVAAGDYHRSIDPVGPTELSAIAESVERMRENIVRSGDQLLHAEAELARQGEQERLAADLHDMTIQRVFALGLALTSVARRHPLVEADLMPLVSDTDETIRELRAVIFQISRVGDAQSLRAAVLNLAHDSGRALGFDPAVEFIGPVDAYAAEDSRDGLLAAVHEALSNAARHAQATSVTVRLEATDGALTLIVADDGIGIAENARKGNGLANLHERAERLGGTVTVSPGQRSGTVISLRVPAQ